MRRKQSARGGVWYMGGRKRHRVRPRGGMFPFGAIAAPILGAVAQPLLKNIFGGKRRRKRVRYV